MTLSRSNKKINSHSMKSDCFQISGGNIKEKQKREIKKEVKTTQYPSSPFYPMSWSFSKREAAERLAGIHNYDKGIRMFEASEERQQREMETSGGKEDREGSGLTSLSTKRIPTREHPQGLLRKAPAAVQSTEMSQPNSGCSSSCFTLTPTAPLPFTSQT